MNRELLFKPCNIGNVEIKNRIVMAPITPNLASPDGEITNDLLHFYEARAKGGIGLIITGWSFIGDESSRDIGLQIGMIKNRFIPGLNVFTEAIHQWGTKIFIQLSYIGRKLIHKDTFKKGASTYQGLIGSNYELYKPEELTIKELEDIAKLYGEAALRSKVAGFDGIEIAMTQGEFFYSFLLEKFNKRKDIYNSGLESRILFPLKILENIRYCVGKEFPVGFRLSGFEDPHYVNDKLIDPEEAERIAEILEKEGVAYIDIFRSMLPVYVTQRKFATAETIKKVVSIPIIATGSIVEPEQAEMVISLKIADFVAIGRGLIADPDWANKVYENRCDEIIKCIRCNECLSRVTKLQILRCTVNVNTGVEGIKKSLLISKPKKRIAIIGGGPAGIKAAITASERGHDVVLFEKRNDLGGNLIPASEPYFKEDFKNLLKQLRNELYKSSVKVILNREVYKISSEMQDFDIVILATGSTPKELKIPIENNVKMYSYYDAICEPAKIKGKNIIIIGGGLIGCETALFLKYIGKNIQIIEIEKDILLDEHEFFKRTELMWMLNNSGIQIFNKSALKNIYKDNVEFFKDDEVFSVPYDSLILTIGLKPNNILFNNDNDNKVNRIQRIGDCKSIGNLFDAIHEGYSAGSVI